jgi:class 3 adenylate cyclase
MRCPNCQTLNPPNAKFCLECGNRLVVCPNCGTVNLPFAKFCIECGASLAPASEKAQNGGSPTLSTTPVVTRVSHAPDTLTNGNKRAGAAFEGNRSKLVAPEERRVVTIMFADIIGSTPLADRLDPEDLRAILAGYFNLMAEQIRRHGGTVEKYIGDAVMAVFGSPVAHEDDPDRAIRAALDMQAALNRFNARRLEHDATATRLQMRIGINTGEVAAPGSASNRQDFLITGDAVNVASRLQTAASPDTILVGERTYLATRNVFEYRPIAPLNLRGKAEPVEAWVVQGERRFSPAITQHPRGIDGLRAPLVGRALELTLMHATYARVQAEQRPHLITILGVPGIGKSRLVRDFIQREEEAAKSASSDSRMLAPRVLQGRCPPYGEGITYWPLIEILRSLLQVKEGESREDLQSRLADFARDILVAARRSEVADEVAAALSRSIGGASPHATTAVLAQGGPERRDIQRSTRSKSSEQAGPQVELMRAWRVFLEAIAEREPLILVIDDLQWADEALLDLLEYLTDRITAAPILFLCPARPDFFERRRDWGGGRRNFTTIVLEALNAEESNELIRGLLNAGDLPEVLYHTIQSRAEGNPFFVEEIVRMLIDQGVLVQENGCWRVSEQNEAALGELASPAAPPDDTLIDQHYVLPLPLLPDTVQGVLAARIDLLSQVEKEVLQYAAIIGRTFWLSAVIELATQLDSEMVLSTIEALTQRDFISETDKPIRTPVPQDRVYSFKHILIRDVVYNNIPRLRRSQKHAQLAVWLEEQAGEATEQYAELLAYHYQQALATWSAGALAHAISDAEHQNGQDTASLLLTRQELMRRTITYQTIAGDQAYHSYYTIRAIQAYTETLDLLYESNAAPLTIARMHQKLGDAYTQRANADEAWHEYKHALELLKQEQERPEAQEEKEGEEPIPDGRPQGDAPTMQEHEVHEGRPQGDAHRDDLLCLYLRLAELSARWLGWFNEPPDMQEMRSYIDAGLQLLAGQPQSGDHAAFLTYLAMWSIRQIDPASPDRRPAIAEEALANIHNALRIAEEVDDTGALWVTLDALGFIYERQHLYLDAHKVHHRRQALASLIKGREELFDLYASLGWCHNWIADYPAAAMWYGRAWRIAQTMESPSMLLLSMIGRMYVWYEWNRWSEVREVAYNAMQMAEQYQLDDQWLLDSLETLADIAYRTGNREESDTLVRQYRRLAEQRGIEPELTRSIYLAREDWARAYSDFKEALQRSEPFPRPSVLAFTAELSVTIGEDAEIQQQLCERAVTLTERAGARKYQAIALRARGRMHMGQAHWDDAERDLKRALAQCKMLDLPWERGQTLANLGRLYLARTQASNLGDQEARAAHAGLARRALEQALGFFESLNAVNDAERVRQALANL